MNSSMTVPHGSSLVPTLRTVVAIAALGAAVLSQGVQAQTILADQPVFTAPTIPGNVALALSVEWPTVQRTAHTGAYSSANNYLGYFDPAKCYTYQPYATETATDLNHFYPDGTAAVDGSGASLHTCSGKWSGNFLNWAATPTIDPFRWAMTGGYRVQDTITSTILEKAWSSSDGNLYPDKNIGDAGTIAAATPLTWGALKIRIDHLGNKMRFTNSGTIGNTGAAYTSGDPSGANVHEVFVRVKVCSATGGAREANCVQYGSNWKPEGLIQKYSKKMRFSAFGYLNDSNPLRDGGVLRARQKFVGPTQPVPGSAAITNTRSEWRSDDGRFIDNPDDTDATATNSAFTPSPSVVNSGVMNYLNKFGEITRTSYKNYDPVSELYYATLRYLKNLGNVPSYSDMSGTTDPAVRGRWADGFPVITNWDDPVQYACQRSFVLGIGDIYTWNDKNLPGNTSTNTEPGLPGGVSGDTSYTATINAITATDKVFDLQGLAAPNRDSYSGRNNSAGIAGLAYDANTRDIRPDFTGKQTVQTYWVDVLEQPFVANNQFYLAAKYGGMRVPANFDPYAATATLTQEIQDSWWHTPNGATDTNLVGTQLRPDNYYTGGRPDQLIKGLNDAFASIAAQITSYTTSFSTSLPQVAQSGNSSFSSKYDANNWTGEVTASNLSFDTSGVPSIVSTWNFSDVLANQLSGTGWDTNRRVVSWDGTTGVRFRMTTATLPRLATAEQTTLGATAAAQLSFLNYLRGDRTNEGTYRTRAKLLGDIVGSKARPVGPPSFPYSDAANPGYSAFKTARASRRTVVYVGANDGMMHAINGALATAQPSPTPTPPWEVDADAGTEMFAYVPRALFQGPNSTPTVDGLASLGNPAFTHHYMVNATPNVFDVDFARTPADVTDAPQTGTADWRSILIGGLGKGGKSYYAIDVTDPQAMVTGGEATVAGKVLWEITHADLGFTFGEPAVVKTRRYGWVVLIPSGYNNTDGQGHILVVNPRTGKVLQSVSTLTGTTANPAGLAHLNAFVVDATDGTADSVYAGDLLGNVWRMDLTAPPGTAYTAPLKIATLADAGGTAQPITSRPSIEVHPSTKQRFVMVGTGRLLDATDVSSTQGQTFYAITDGTNARFNVATDLPTGITFPIDRSMLVPATTPLTGVTFDPNTKMGWYEELGTGTGGIGWRVTTDSSTLSGSVAFAATLPNGSVCTPSGDSRIYGRDYAIAKTTIKVLSGTTLVDTAYISQGGTVTDLRYLSVGGKATLLSGSDTGNVGKIEITPTPGVTVRRLNWRELLTVD